MPSRKRAREEVEPKEENAQAPKEITLLDRIRSTSEFAAFNQYLFIFGKAMKVPEFTIEVRSITARACWELQMDDKINC